MNLVIGYVGGAFSGKDTSSKELKKLLFRGNDAVEHIEDATLLVGEKIKYNTQDIILWHLPLALGVKIEFVEEQALLGIKIDLKRLLYDELYKNNYRADLIRIGDGRRETIHPLYWIKKTQTLLEEIEARHSDFVNLFQITDMRYENEVPEFEVYCYEKKTTNMLSIKVNTSLATVLKRMPIKNAVDYAQKYRCNKSERNIKRIHADIELDNNGTIKELGEQIKALVLPVVGMILAPNS